MAYQWKVGDRIEARWEILKILKGGMGCVFVARDRTAEEASNPKRAISFPSGGNGTFEFPEIPPVAIKTFRDDVLEGSPLIAERFVKEALVWLKVERHRNVTQAIAVRRVLGKPLLFLEYASGGDLAQWIATCPTEKRLAPTVRFAVQFCEGMVHILSKGIKAHRDIKPSNCLIAENGTLKVTDFGLATVFDDQPLSESDTADGRGLRYCQTSTGVGAGTPHYMAPEQFEDAKRVDVRADIYSFGVMLYEMATGMLPFNGRTLSDLRRMHTHQEPPSLSSPIAVLNEIVRTCLAKDPARRPADFGALREKLQEVFDQLHDQAAPQTKSTIRPKAESISCGKLTLVPADSLETDQDPLKLAAKGASFGELGLFEQALDCLNRALTLCPLPEVYSNKASILEKMRRFEEALECCERAIEMINQDPIQRDRKGRLGHEWSNKGIMFVKLNRSREALTCFDQALAFGHDQSGLWNGRGCALLGLRQNDEALRSFECAIRLNPESDEAWRNRAGLLANLGRFQEALSSSERALQLNPRHPLAWYTRGLILLSVNKPNDAVPCFDRALELNPGFVDAWINKGKLLLMAFKQTGAALHCFEEAHQLGDPEAPQLIAFCRQQMRQ